MTTPSGEPRQAVIAPARAGRHPVVRVPTLVVGGLLVALLLGGGTFVAANVLVRSTETDSVVLTGEVRRVEVVVTGTVDIEVGPADRARVDRRSTFGLARPEVVHTLEDGLLTVRVECTGGTAVICRNQVDLQVPRDASIAVDSLGARVSDVDGDVEVDSGAGTVELDRLSGQVTATVGGGSIVGRELRSAEVRADAGAGSVDLTFALPPDDVDASSGAGSVVVEVPRGEEAYRVDATAGAGEDLVSVRTDPTSDRVIRVGAGAGSVEVRYRT